MTGWACPKCGRVYSPWVAECRYCNHDQFSEQPPYIIPYTPPPVYPTPPLPYDWPYKITCESQPFVKPTGMGI